MRWHLGPKCPTSSPMAVTLGARRLRVKLAAASSPCANSSRFAEAGRHLAEVVVEVSSRVADDDVNGSAFAGLGQRGLVGRMHAQLDELLAARDQMEQLLRVFVEIGADLDLDPTLHRIIAAARRLTSAPYGALAIRDPDGNLLRFIHEGMDADTVGRIGHLPVGKGLLSLSLLDTPALRVDDLTAHPSAVGFPEHHPPMRAFLAVPITIRGIIYGNIYLTHVDPARVFSESDEVAARALAFAAAASIDNAQLFERERLSVKWMEASREITTALLSSTEPNRRPLRLIAESVRILIDAEQANVL